MKRNKIIGIILFIFIIIGGVVGCSNNSKETVGKSIAQNEKDILIKEKLELMEMILLYLKQNSKLKRNQGIRSVSIAMSIQ